MADPTRPLNPKLIPVDGRRLAKEYRDALSPGGMRCDSDGVEHRLPRFFYEIPSWDYAMAVRLTQNFGLWELIQTDVREAAVLQSFPRYIPCALPLLFTTSADLPCADRTFVALACRTSLAP